MAKGYKLKGHGSFAIREGWLTKGLLAIDEFEKKKPDKNFFGKDNFGGADALGVGANMALSIKYWMKAAGLLEGNASKLTSFAKIILKFDPYFEEYATLWMLHINITSNFEEATVWNLFFNTIRSGEFERYAMEERLTERFETIFPREEYAKTSFQNDCYVLLLSYVNNYKSEIDPEDKSICPLQSLKLVTVHGKKYVREICDSDLMNDLVVFYAIRKYLSMNYEKNIEKGSSVLRESISIDKLLRDNNSPGAILGLSRIGLNDALDELERRGFIQVDRTAGLDVVYIKKEAPASLNEIAKKYYEENQ